MKKKQQSKPKEAGQSLVEMAMSLFFLTLLVAGVADLGRAFFTYIALRDAAQEGAAYGSIARGYTEGPMMCNEIIARAYSTSNTQIVDLTDTTVTILYYDKFDYNYAAPVDCYSLDPVNVSAHRRAACFDDRVRVIVTYPDFPLTTPFLGTLLGTQTIPIQASIIDTVLTPPCK